MEGIYKRGTLSVKHHINKGEGLDPGAEPPLIKLVE